MFVCEVCQKEYQSKSGLRRHVKSKHRVAVPMLETAGAAEGGKAGRVPASERSEGPPVSDRPACRAPSRGKVDWLPGGVVDEEAKTACKELGVDEDDVMAYRVYHQPLKVVLIEGPVGFKRVWLGK